MSFGQCFRQPRHLLVLFLTATVIPAAALAWLGWRLLQQDRDLETQHVQDRLENAAALVAVGLERRLSEVEKRLPELVESPPADLPAGALFVVFRPSGVQAHPAGRLLYYPFLPSSAALPAYAFAAGEALEFQQRDYPKAAAEFRKLARSDNLQVRAGALVRLARNLRKNDQREKALSVYEQLAGLGSVPAGDVPAALLARHARCELLAELNRHTELQREAGALARDLQTARWTLDHASFEFYSQSTQRWLVGQAQATPPPGALAVAAAVESLWQQWRGSRSLGESTRGRRNVWAKSQSVLVVWHGSRERQAALVAAPRYLESEWQDEWRRHRVSLSLIDSDGRRVLGEPFLPERPQAVRTTADTRLPWTLRVASADPEVDLARLAGRRRLLLAGLGIMALVVIAAGYFTGRAAVREVAVARLQSDFVSAVSHEFRSPLTSMRHLTELLEGDKVSSEDRRRQYYGMLSRETRRLHRLVEGLLNFGRMEAGVMHYRFQELDPAGLARDVVAEFREETPKESQRIAIKATCDLPSIRADREALGSVVWNLLDNAVKYSAGGSVVEVAVEREDRQVAIHVRDHGLGILPVEQKAIFRKFVRGAASEVSHIKGTGIGLSLVEHIVSAHGGLVRLQSEPGRGSTFTVLVPACEEVP